MVDHREPRVSGAPWLILVAVAAAVLLSATASRAAEALPYMTITAWQKDVLSGTEFSTSPIQKKGERYYLVRRLLRGEVFEPVVQKYCEAAGFDVEGCNGVREAAQSLHFQEHTHRNWQVLDRIYLGLPEGVYPPRAPGR